MIKQLFNSPWFVGALGIFAAGYLGWSMMGSFSGSEMAAQVDWGDPVEDVATYNTDARIVAAVGRENIGWLDDIERDPFAGTQLAADTGAHGGAGPSREPSIGALFSSPEAQAAVVNNKLVRVGDRVDQYEVTAITDRYVELMRGGRLYKFEPEV